MHTTNSHPTTNSHVHQKQPSQPHHASIAAPSIAAPPLDQPLDQPMVQVGRTIAQTIAQTAADCKPLLGPSLAAMPRSNHLQPMVLVEPERPLFDLALKRFKRPSLSATNLLPPQRSRKVIRRSPNLLVAARQQPLQSIQHHHVHVAACLAENHCPLHVPAVLSVALDEFGHSENGTLWGGEFFLADYRHCQRVGTFKPVSVLDAGQTLDRPWCNTYSHLIAAFDWEDLQAVYGDLELLQFFNQQPRSVVTQLLIQRIQAPLTSSVSRLFDAVAAAIGICRDQPIPPGHGSLSLANLIQPHHLDQVMDSSYQFELRYLGRDTALPYLESRSMWQALLEDLLQHSPTPLMAARFHVGLSQAIGQMVSHLQGQYVFKQVALTGSVFQNPVLLQQVSRCLSQMGLTVLTHRLFPCRNADLLLGQAAIATARSV